MTDAAENSRVSAPRDRTNAALLGVVIVLAVINSVITWFGRNIDTGSDIVGATYAGFVVFQPMALGVWTALGAGSIYTRIPMAVLCNILLFVAPGTIPANFGNVELFEFVAIASTGLAIFVMTTLLFLIFHRFTRLRFQSAANADTGLQFSMQYVLCLMTITAVCLAMALNLKFHAESPPGNNFLGTDLLLIILFIMGAMFSAAVLPTMAVPLLILYGQPSLRAKKWCAAFWLIVSAVVVIAAIGQDAGGETIPGILIAQFISALAGGLAAKALRWSGLRLIRSPATDVQVPDAST